MDPTLGTTDVWDTKLTLCGVEDSPWLAAAGLPVNTVGQRANEVVLRALHDLLTHLVELLSVVDPAVELGVSIREFYMSDGRRTHQEIRLGLARLYAWQKQWHWGGGNRHYILFETVLYQSFENIWEVEGPLRDPQKHNMRQVQWGRGRKTLT